MASGILMDSNRPMRAALYVRVSKDNGSQTTDNQELQLRGLAHSRGWPIVKVYRDQASGAKDANHREGLREMLNDAAAHRFDVVLFWSLDRLTRLGPLDALQTLQKLSSCEPPVKWVSHQEQYFDSCGPFADAVVAIIATIAREERVRLIARTKAGLERVRSQGTKLGRPARYFDIDRVRFMQSQGKSLRQIARELDCSLSFLVKRLRKAKAAEVSGE